MLAVLIHIPSLMWVVLSGVRHRTLLLLFICPALQQAYRDIPLGGGGEHGHIGDFYNVVYLPHVQTFIVDLDQVRRNSETDAFLPAHRSLELSSRSPGKATKHFL